MVRKWGTSIFSNGRGGRRRKRRPWCPQPRRVKRREPCCNSWTRKGGPDFQIGDRVEVIRNNNPARRKYAGRIIAVKKGRLGHLGEEQEKIFLFFCNPFARLITCDQCHCPQDYFYDVEYDTVGLVDGTVEKSVDFERIFHGAMQAAPVVPDAEATLVVNNPTEAKANPSTAV